MPDREMRRRESGYALLVVLLLAALVLIALAAVAPRVLTQGQREKEEELIFRGEQYRRAIGVFYKKLNRYPNTVEELLRTNDRSFLRREYRDPMTPDGKWRFIRVGPNGEFIGAHSRRSTGGRGEGGDEGDDEDEENGAEEEDTAEPPAGGSAQADNESLPLAGVASRSPARSIRVYQGEERYDLWEFIYDPTQEALGGKAGQPPQPPGRRPQGPPR